MVRLKNRYLLVNILYPGLDNKNVDNKNVDPKIPDVVVFNQPTTDSLTTHALVKGIKTEVSNLFGDHGAGAIAESIVVKYLSPATSTFILRVSRAQYRLVWAALSFMTILPIKNGKSCVFRVVRVSGTIRKAEEEAIQRARQLILKARREMAEQGDSTLDNMFGKADYGGDSMKDTLMVDREDSDEEDEDLSDGD
ncbi:Ribonuclease P MRP subunit POP5 [Hyphodiscus hymeniophilus]|uniref:Ribonuclease P/MRP protein subunit POP5 n=1 Tax=Hyphodiscus hymeniophilus TaxID=353542 RepID=A0A9P6VT59_9HELO|nr:Ribonuclease P MRP subunit POP5 [Hyphodiscus hymeniophilus]